MAHMCDLRMISEVDLSRVPDTATAVNMQNQKGVTSLHPLMRCKQLAELNCTGCTGLVAETVLQLKRELPSIVIDLTNCHQLAGDVPGVTAAIDGIFLKTLGMVPPRLKHLIPACKDDQQAWEPLMCDIRSPTFPQDAFAHLHPCPSSPRSTSRPNTSKRRTSGARHASRSGGTGA